VRANKSIESPSTELFTSQKWRANTGELNFDYVTINSMDQSTKRRMEEDVRLSDYKGSKSNYIITLCNEALTARENKRIAKTEQGTEGFAKTLNEINERLKGIDSLRGQQDIDGMIDRLLVVETYRLVSKIADSIGVKHDDIENGQCDALPTHLRLRKEEMEKAYGDI
jgi:hypothetical protein